MESEGCSNDWVGRMMVSHQGWNDLYKVDSSDGQDVHQSTGRHAHVYVCMCVSERNKKRSLSVQRSSAQVGLSSLIGSHLATVESAFRYFCCCWEKERERERKKERKKGRGVSSFLMSPFYSFARFSSCLSFDQTTRSEDAIKREKSNKENECNGKKKKQKHTKGDKRQSPVKQHRWDLLDFILEASFTLLHLLLLHLLLFVVPATTRHEREREREREREKEKLTQQGRLSQWNQLPLWVLPSHSQW